eukprot:scaffold22602_cov154-Cylindrotheca_fusiformis.AAC.5
MFLLQLILLASALTTVTVNAYIGMLVHPNTVRSIASLQVLGRHYNNRHPRDITMPFISSNNGCRQKHSMPSRQIVSPSRSLIVLHTSQQANEIDNDGESTMTLGKRMKSLPGKIIGFIARIRIRSPVYLIDDGDNDAHAASSSEEENAKSSADNNNGGTEEEDDREDDETTMEAGDEGEGSESEDEYHSDRRLTSAEDVDFSGIWRPIVNSDFKDRYDDYLKNCSQSFMFRKVIVNGISTQKETFRHLDGGENLQIIASNPVGNWNRTLVASTESSPKNVTIKDPDGDKVQVESWWEQDGRVHKSWLREKPRVKGGEFETARYMESDDVLYLFTTQLPLSRYSTVAPMETDLVLRPSCQPRSRFRSGSTNILWRQAFEDKCPFRKLSYS